jgi:hypothetical protein
LPPIKFSFLVSLKFIVESPSFIVIQ